VSGPLRLSFPCGNVPKNINEQGFRSSALMHTITSVIISIILGLGAATAAYFLTQGIIWSALIGTSTAVITGLIAYVILRCTLGKRTSSQKEKKNQVAKPVEVNEQQPAEVKKQRHVQVKTKLEIVAPDKDWTGLIIEDSHEYTGDLNAEQKSKLILKDIDKNTFQIGFGIDSPFSVTIRCQNMFASGAEVLVNAANNGLVGGGGIDGGIHKEGGQTYINEHQGALKSKYKGRFVTGHAAMIGSGALKEKYKVDNVIVVAGPIGSSKASKEDQRKKENQLYTCYYNSLILAHNHKKNSIAFPGISTGIYGFNKDRGAAIALKAIYDFIAKHPNTTLKTISLHYLKPNEKILESYKAATAVL